MGNAMNKTAKPTDLFDLKKYGEVSFIGKNGKFRFIFTSKNMSTGR